jgi:serine/threonine-protein kinase
MSQVSRTSSNTPRFDARAGQYSAIGNWFVVELLAESQWSRVYRAKPRSSPEKSAFDYVLKVARQDVGVDNAMAAALVRREARVGYSVTHPHLASILSSHVNEPPHYVVMPYLNGATLEAALGAVETIPLPHALWTLRQATQAMAALHENGWLHSDVKPHNIFISPNGHVTLLDLGLARRIGWSDCGSEGPLVGTLAYTAPESLNLVEEIGPPSDIYSMGVTLFRMLTGSLPFTADNAADLVTAHLHRTPPDARRLNPLLPSRVIRLLKRMLAKQPARRPCAAQLVSWLADLEIETFGERFAA